MVVHVAEHIRKQEIRRSVRFVIKLTVYIGIIFFLSRYPELPEQTGIPPSVTSALLFFLPALITVSFIRLIIVFLYLRKHKLRKDVKTNFVLGINRIADITMVAVSIISLLLLFGKNPLEFITSLSIVAAAIAILSKDYISNMINGMILMFSDELSLGDYVKIGENKGKITDITLINVHMINDDEDLIYITNNTVLNSEVINYTKRAVRKVGIDFDIKNEFLGNMNAFEQFLIEQLNEYNQAIRPDSFNLKIVKMQEGFSSLKFQFVLTRSAPIHLEREMRRKILRSVLEYTNRTPV